MSISDERWSSGIRAQALVVREKKKGQGKREICSGMGEDGRGGDADGSGRGIGAMTTPVRDEGAATLSCAVRKKTFDVGKGGGTLFAGHMIAIDRVACVRPAQRFGRQSVWKRFPFLHRFTKGKRMKMGLAHRGGGVCVKPITGATGAV